MLIPIRNIKTSQDYQQVINYLKEDVDKSGGSVSELINVHNHLYEITFSSSPWGPIMIRKRLSRLEAIVSWLSTDYND